MTNQDDRQRFDAMMAGAGWRKLPTQIFEGCWEWSPNPLIRYFSNGQVVTRVGKHDRVSQVGPWRQWLEAGQTPPPF